MTYRWLIRGASVVAFALGAALGPATVGSGLHAGTAFALPAHLPNRCFSAAGTQHVIFGPEAGLADPPAPSPNTSFSDNFNPVTLQGPTMATLPMYTGTSPRGTTTYIITEASDLGVATALGVNYAPKLAKLLGPLNASVENDATQDVGPTNANGIQFPAGVNFVPGHVLIPSNPNGFPPLAAQPGADGDNGYSPLVQVLYNGTPVVLNAPQIANPTGRADKLASVDIFHKTVNYLETDGCYDNESMHYISTDASDAGAAAIEDVTYAPNLNLVPAAGCADAAVPAPNCARESLAAFTNGQTGVTNPERQGLNAALKDRLPPMNNLKEVPHLGAVDDYSPIWDVHLTTWRSFIPVSQRLRQTNFPDIVALAMAGTVTGYPEPTPWGASGFVVNCPVISIDENTP